jgi:hypothetical protein
MAGTMGDDALIGGALRDLLAAWHLAGDRWRDQARADFTQIHLEPIEASAREAARAIVQVERLLAEVSRQCR